MSEQTADLLCARSARTFSFGRSTTLALGGHKTGISPNSVQITPLMNRDVNQASERHFVYMLAKEGGTYDIVVVRPPASPEVVAEYEAITAVIPRIQPVVLALAVCERDFRTLAEMAEAQQARVSSLGHADISVALVHELLAESASCLGAFLASASAFLGQAPQTVRDVLQDDPALMAEWNARRNDLHARSIGYRLLYELRNFAQHYALPVSTFRISGTRAPDTDAMSLECGAYLSRHKLLTSGYAWRARESDLAAQPDEFDVRPLADDYMRCIRTLVVEAMRPSAPDLAVCRDYLARLRALFKVPVAARLYLFDGMPDVGGGSPSNAQVIPEEQLAWLLDAVQRAAGQSYPV